MADNEPGRALAGATQRDGRLSAERRKVRWKVVLAAETAWTGAIYETRAGYRREEFDGPEDFLRAVMRLTGWNLSE